MDGSSYVLQNKPSSNYDVEGSNTHVFATHTPFLASLSYFSLAPREPTSKLGTSRTIIQQISCSLG